MSFLNKSSRLGSDINYLNQTEIQNIKQSNYRLENFYENNDPRRLYMNQPCVQYQCSYGVGKEIDIHSKLTLGSIQSNPRYKTNVFQRPYLTVPFLGRGNACPVLESQLRNGDHVPSKKSENQTSEKQYYSLLTQPLLEEMEYNNHARFMVEEVANPNFIRGGIPSREITRDTEYINIYGK